jgi:hypothetical protein
MFKRASTIVGIGDNGGIIGFGGLTMPKRMLKLLNYVLGFVCPFRFHPGCRSKTDDVAISRSSGAV